MTGRDSVVFLPGGGARDQELVDLRRIMEAEGRFRLISFPGWQRYVSKDFSAENLIRELVTFIATEVPRGPIRIVGLSLGAHLGYATAVRLQAMGRTVTGFCAIDGMMTGHPWKQGIELLREGQLRILWRLARAKLRHSIIRLRRESTPVGPTSNYGAEKLPDLVLWLESARAWTSSLDLDPVPLKASNALVRTRPGAIDDAVWKRRCPNIHIFDVPGTHHTFLTPKHMESFRRAISAATRDWP